MNFILVLAGVLIRVPKIALDLWHHCAHSCKEGCQGHLVAVPRVYRFSSFGENQKVLAYLVKLFHWVLNVNINAFRVYIFSFQEKLNRINLRCVQLGWLFFPLLKLLYTSYWLLLHLWNFFFFLLVVELELIIILLCRWWSRWLCLLLHGKLLARCER